MGWRDVEYELAPIDDSRLLEVVRLVKTSHVNGGAILCVFQPTSDTAFESAARSDLQGIDHLLRCFLEAASVREAVPDLKLPYPLAPMPQYTWYGTYEFEGAVTHLLLVGGAYKSAGLSEDQARSISRAFVDALAGNARLQTSVYRISGAWTDWFLGIAWDRTFVVYQRVARRWALFCATDTD
jgi:hypothetical protein